MHTCRNEYSLIWAYQNPILADAKVREDFLEHKEKADYNFFVDRDSFIVVTKKHFRTINQPENDFWEFEMEQAIDAIHHAAEKLVQSQYKDDQFMLDRITKERNENLARHVT